jgi:hypothetical protein
VCEHQEEEEGAFDTCWSGHCITSLALWTGSSRHMGTSAALSSGQASREAWASMGMSPGVTIRAGGVGRTQLTGKGPMGSASWGS